MSEYTQYIFDNPVAMLKVYIAAVNKNNSTPEIVEIARLYNEVQAYIQLLESEREMLRSKLS